MELKEKQKRILEELKKEDKIATTKIAFLISCNLYQTESLLKELEIEGLIIREVNGEYATYWSLYHGKKI